jgi:hypothetical protein
MKLMVSAKPFIAELKSVLPAILADQYANQPGAWLQAPHLAL